jgi:hypothetical protein
MDGDGDITDADIREVLRMYERLPGGQGLVSVPRLANQLGCDESVARIWLDKVVASGHITGPLFARFDNGEWSEVGYGLTAKGRDVLAAAES